MQCKKTDLKMRVQMRIQVFSGRKKVGFHIILTKRQPYKLQQETTPHPQIRKIITSGLSPDIGINTKRKHNLKLSQ